MFMVIVGGLLGAYQATRNLKSYMDPPSLYVNRAILGFILGAIFYGLIAQSFFNWVFD